MGIEASSGTRKFYLSISMPEMTTKEIKKSLLYTMLKIRRFEEKIMDVYPEQEMKTPVHLYIGEEAIAVGVCANLKQDDYIFTTHRNHGHCIAKGVDIKLLAAELYGKGTGCSRGKGGSMHPVDPEHGILGTSAIVGGGIALAVGSALASKLKKENKISVAFFGDGAVDEGAFYESVNFAALRRLPIVFVCENNFYATNSPQSARQPLDNIFQRVLSFGIPTVQIDGNDVLEIYSKSKEYIERARAENAPALIECRTFRFRGHVGPEDDCEKGYRPKKELEEWLEKCPIETYKNELIKNKELSTSDFQDMVREIDSHIESAFKFAKESRFPVAEELYKDVYYEKR